MKFNYDKVESIIGYEFNNKKLLKQAFIRSSYAYEKNRPSNEILEFIGDKALDLVIIRLLLGGKNKKISTDSYFHCRDSEGDLTRMKAEIVSSGYLAKTIDELGLEQFILYGTSDKNNDLQHKQSVKEDLFEAIVGATTLDCNWDMDLVYDKVMRLFRSVNKVMKQAQMNNNYVGQLQERISKLGLEQPKCSVESYRKNNIQGWAATYKFGDILTSKSFGLTQKEAKRNAAKGVLDYLDKHQNELVPKKENFNVFEFINQMVQTKVIAQPSFGFSAEYDKDGNPWWICKARIDGEVFTGVGRTQKGAKEGALLGALKMVNEKLGRKKHE